LRNFVQSHPSYRRSLMQCVPRATESFRI
jgi:hypothetical protein